MASPTVRMVSAASSGISQPNSSSNAITSSTVSRLSAPRSSMKLAFSVTFSGSTPRCSTTIFFTRSAISLIVLTSCVSSDGPIAGALASLCGTASSWLTLAGCGPIVDRPCVTPVPRPVRSPQPSRGSVITLLQHWPAGRARSAGRGNRRQTPPNHDHSSVHVECLSGHIGGLVGDEEEDRRSALVDRAEPAGRDVVEDCLALLLVERPRHRGLDETGRH